MTVLITLTGAGTDTGPFDLYSNLDGYVTPFETGVSKAALLGGYTSIVVPDYTTSIRIKSEGVCINFVNIDVVYPTTTTTTTAAPVTTTTTTTAGTTTTTTTAVPVCSEYQSAPYDDQITLSYVDCYGNVQATVDFCYSVICTYTVCAYSIISSTETMFNLGPCPTTTTTTTAAPTTTTTTTVAPTTTTTTTLAYATWDVSTLSNASAVTACTYAVDQNLYAAALPAGVANIAVLYTNTSLTTPFVGDTTFYRIREGGSFFSMNVDASGNVTNVTAC